MFVVHVCVSVCVYLRSKQIDSGTLAKFISFCGSRSRVYVQFHLAVSNHFIATSLTCSNSMYRFSKDFSKEFLLLYVLHFSREIFNGTCVSGIMVSCSAALITLYGHRFIGVNATDTFNCAQHAKSIMILVFMRSLMARIVPRFFSTLCQI